MGPKKKPPKLVKKFRICLLGPSYVGKTQIVNRFINNNFTGYYEPTISCNSYRRAYNLNDDELDLDPVFFDIEILDLFPHDHPNMDQEIELMTEEAKEMEKELSKIIKSPYENITKEDPLSNRIHAYIFVYDASNKRTFESMVCMIETIMEYEH